MNRYKVTPMLFVPVMLLALGCGDDDGAGLADATAGEDAPSTCSVETLTIDQTVLDQGVATVIDANVFFSFRLNFGPDGAKDRLRFDQAKPATLNQDLQLAVGDCQTPSPCVLVLANFTVDAVGVITQEQTFYAVSGTVNTTRADNVGGRFMATLTNIQLEAAGESCKLTIPSMTIDLPVVAEN